MESFEALSTCIGRESDPVAKVTGKSVDLVRKWKEDPIDGSGIKNPLDMIRDIMVTSLRAGRTVQDVSAVNRYLEEVLAPYSETSSVQDAHSDLMTEVSHLFQEHAAAVRDGRISADERRRLHRESHHVRTALEDYDRAISEVEVSK